MWKRLMLLGIGFLVLLAVLVLISIGLAKRQSGSSASAPITTVASDWANSMLEKYPYKEGSYSGVKPTPSLVIVWIIGRRVTSKDGQISGFFTIEENDRSTITGKLSQSVFYTVQEGDDFSSLAPPQRIDPENIFFGDYVAARTTYLNSLPFILEVRKLNRPPKNQ